MSKANFIEKFSIYLWSIIFCHFKLIHY